MAALIWIIGITAAMAVATAGVVLAGCGIGYLVDNGLNFRDAATVIGGFALVTATIVIGALAIDAEANKDEKEQAWHCQGSTEYIEAKGTWWCQ